MNRKYTNLDNRTAIRMTIKDIANDGVSMIEKYWMRQNLPISETRVAEKRMPYENQIVFFQLRLDSRLLPNTLRHLDEIRKMELCGENEI